MAGEILPPGGILFQGEYWCFFLHHRSLLVAGQGFIALRRHCETLAGLSSAEAAELGIVMQRVSAALTEVVGAEKVHFGLYAEDVKHLHVHVIPRTSTLPAGNIPLTLLSVWYRFLATIGLRQTVSPESVSRVASQLKAALALL